MALVCKRYEQGSNLRIETPLYFESNTLISRPSQHVSAKFIAYNIRDMIKTWFGGWGSRVKPVSCYPKVAGLTPLVCMSCKCPWTRYWFPKLFLMCWSTPCMAATAISVWTYVWITVSHWITVTLKLHRCEQGLNLRGETPLDFKSNALTTRPSQPFLTGLL